MNTSQLYQLAEQAQVQICYFDLPKNRSVSLQAPDGCCTIGMDTQLHPQSADERVCLAHELGHCLTGSFYNIYAPLDLREKHEHRANAWAVRQLVPHAQLQNALQQGYTQIWELAEHFGVTEDFMRKALTHYGLLHT